MSTQNDGRLVTNFSIPFDVVRDLVVKRNIHGWLFDGEPERLYEEAMKAPGPIVEIGSYGGRSTCYLAAPGMRRVWAVDPLDHEVERATTQGHQTPGDDPWDYLVGNLEYVGVRERVTIVRGLSCDVADLVPDQIGLLFVDGDHSYQGVYTDLSLYAPRVVPGGVVMCHDWNFGDSEGKPIQRALQNSVCRDWPCEVLINSMGILRRPIEG